MEDVRAHSGMDLKEGEALVDATMADMDTDRDGCLDWKELRGVLGAFPRH
jgi:hypothetical protein